MNKSLTSTYTNVEKLPWAIYVIIKHVISRGNDYGLEEVPGRRVKVLR